MKFFLFKSPGGGPGNLFVHIYGVVMTGPHGGGPGIYFFFFNLGLSGVFWGRGGGEGRWVCGSGGGKGGGAPHP